MANHHLINHLIISLTSTLLQCSFLTPWSWTYMYTESVYMYTGDFAVYLREILLIFRINMLVTNCFNI